MLPPWPSLAPSPAQWHGGRALAPRAPALTGHAARSSDTASFGRLRREGGPARLRLVTPRPQAGRALHAKPVTFEMWPGSMADEFYLRYYTGHQGKFGHEFLEFEFRYGKARAA